MRSGIRNRKQPTGDLMGTVLKLVPKHRVVRVKSKYPPRNREALRPFRLWDTKDEKWLPFRCYKTRENAMRGALLISFELHINQSIEVLDQRYQKCWAQFTAKIEDGRVQIRINEF